MDTLLLSFMYQGVPYQNNIAGELLSGIYFPKTTVQEIILNKEDVDPKFFNRCIQALEAFSTTVDNKRRYRSESDPVIRSLTEATQVSWVSIVPSEYDPSEEVYAPAIQSPNLTHEQRLEQEKLASALFIPRRKQSDLEVKNWTEYQQQVEEAKGLSPSTVLLPDLVPYKPKDNEYKRTVKANLNDQRFLKRIRAAFGSPNDISI